MKILIQTLVIILGLYSCSNIEPSIFNQTGNNPKEIYYNNDTNFVSSKYVYFDNKYSFFSDNNNELILYSIRTDEKLVNNSLYYKYKSSFKIDTNIKKQIAFKIKRDDIEKLNNSYSIDISSYIINDSVQASLRANNNDQFLYFALIPTVTKNRVLYYLNIYVVLDKSKQIKQTFYYFSGDKRE